MTLPEITERLEEIRQTWRTQPAKEQLAVLAELDEFLGTFHQLNSADPEQIDELRGRIEILMDEIEILLGFEPAPVPDATFDHVM